MRHAQTDMSFSVFYEKLAPSRANPHDQLAVKVGREGNRVAEKGNDFFESACVGSGPDFLQRKNAFPLWVEQTCVLHSKMRKRRHVAHRESVVVLTVVEDGVHPVSCGHDGALYKVANLEKGHK
jgi:hypothetical protein